MKVTATEAGQLHTFLKIEIEDSDYREKFNKGLKDLSKKIQMPGFRVGHVPPGMIKKMYGDSVLAEELNRIVNEQVSNYIKENGLRLLGEALPANEERVEIDHNETKPYTFDFELGIQPDIDIAGTLRNAKPFVRNHVRASEEEITDELQRLQRKYGERIDADAAEENDVIYVHLHELNPDGTEKENGIHTDSYFNMQMLTTEGEELFRGSHLDEVKNITDLFSVFKGERERIAKNILHLTDVNEQTLQDVQPSFSAKITKIARIVPAELNEKFFAEASKEYGEVTDEAGIREKIASSIESYNDRMTETKLENDIYNFLMDTTDVPLPEVFLRKWYKSTQQESTGDFEEEFTGFTKRLKQSLIYQKIQREHNLEASKEEVLEESLNRIRMSYGHLGEDFVNYIAQSQLKEKDFIENMHDNVLQKKFYEALKTYVTVEEKDLTAEEFKNLNKEVYAE